MPNLIQERLREQGETRGSPACYDLKKLPVPLTPLSVARELKESKNRVGRNERCS